MGEHSFGKIEHEGPDKAENVRGFFSFCLSLLCDTGELKSLWLPETPEGVYFFSEESSYAFLRVEAKNGRWVVRCSQPAFFKKVSISNYNEVPLMDCQLISIENEDRSYSLYVEKASKDNMFFKNYTVASDAEISIGNKSSNDICCNNPFVSRKHAVLSRGNHRWRVQDLSGDGVYVNNQRVDSRYLRLGDVLFIMGMRIIIGTDFISINNGDGRISLNPRVLKEQMSQTGGFPGYSGDYLFEPRDNYYNRAPRKHTDPQPGTIVVEGPPLSMDKAQMPLMLRMGSSMIMGGGAALAGNYTMLLTSVLFPLLGSKFSDKQVQEYEQLRTTKYREYLEKKREEIENACREERQMLHLRYPSLESAISQAMNKNKLWERRPQDSDFLSVRIGTGRQPLGAVIEYPARSFELEQDALEEEMYALVEQKRWLENVPIALSFMEDNVCGVLGRKGSVIRFIRDLALQMAVFHSYDELKMVFLLSPEDLAQMDYIRYLPHVWDDQRSIRFIATNEAEVYKFGEYLKAQLPEKLEDEKELDKVLKKRPYYMIFTLDKRLFEGHEILRSILHSDKKHGVSILTASDNLPKECRKIITLGEQNRITSLEANGGEDVCFESDLCDDKRIRAAMKVLSNVVLKTAAQEQELPKTVTFLEMFQAGKVEALNPIKRWRENNPVVSLAAPVGIGVDGSLFTLDLHEKRQGPHGLVAGMTGSGKSEFIITYILSMAINYHPDEVAFVLIDYKGGGLASAFENPKTGMRLPHLMGTITNLDGASIQRSLMSIESELKRRQKVFNEVKSATNEGTMDIYAYQKLYRAGGVSEPMPHLFIISDEFAELKQQQPEFMDKLISTARIGRSLGVHLILATQKPSGVVNDQIRSNTKFQICLRVQERSDSMDMLKRPEAAELKDTGRFYLQVGYNEYFALGQSAWCGASYEPQEKVVVQRDDSVEFLDITGQPVSTVKPKVRKTSSGVKQIVAVVKYLSDLAKEQKIRPRQLWKPELPACLEMDALPACASPEGMLVSMGMLDDPERQEQFPLVLDFSRLQNMLVMGDAGSGKTSLVQSVLLSLARRYSPEELNFYILDYSSRMFKSFKTLPHCGAVLYEEDSDSLDTFFKLVNSIVAERKKLFSQLEVDSFESACAIRKMPLILVIIDNYAGLTATKKGEAQTYNLPNYLKDSANYGIKYIITSSHTNEVALRVKQNLGERICLHMKDKYDYGDMLGCRVLYLPPQKPGRGLYNWQGRPLEFQSAIFSGGDDKTRAQLVKNELAMLGEKYGDISAARQMPVLSETAAFEDFARQFKRGRIPLGYSKRDGKPVALPLKQFSALSVYFGNRSGVKPILENLLIAARREGMELWILKRCENSRFDGGENGVDSSLCRGAKFYTADKKSLDRLREDMTKEMSSRRALLDRYCLENDIGGNEDNKYKETFEYLCGCTTPVFVLVEDFMELSDSMDPISAMLYDKLFSVAQKRNIYVTGCFEADSFRSPLGSNFCEKFNPDENVLLFGGRFDKQKLCEDSELVGIAQKMAYNLGVMKYRGQLHPILMPCGELQDETVDEDENSIF